MEGQGILASLLSRYEGIWKVFIQPKRKIYPRDALGPNKRRIDMDTYFQREDNEFYNRRREKIVYTYFAHTSLGQEPQSNESSFGNFFSNFTSFTNFSGTGKRRICMVYLHSHGGSRLESLFLIPYCGSLGIDLCALDFSGSGMSEGEYTTLGINESDDLEDLLQLLIAQKKCSFILWGRSMGAVAAMIHQDKYSQSSQAKVEYIVLDSPFSSVERLVRDVSEAYVTFGEYISMMFYSSIVEVIKGKIGYDFNNLIPLDLCPRLTTPVMFFVGKSDDIVLPIRVKEMHKLYAGPKSFIIVKGNHESARQQHHIEKMITKISKLLNLEKVSSLAQSTNTSEELSDVQNPIMKKLIDLNINLPEFTNTKKAQFTISKNIELSNSRIGLENQYHETQTNLDEANGLLESDVHTKYMKYKTNAVGRANKDFSNFRPPEILGNNHLTRIPVQQSTPKLMTNPAPNKNYDERNSEHQSNVPIYDFSYNHKSDGAYIKRVTRRKPSIDVAATQQQNVGLRGSPPIQTPHNGSYRRIFDLPTQQNNSTIGGGFGPPLAPKIGKVKTVFGLKSSRG